MNRKTANNEQLTMNNEVIGIQKTVDNEQLTMNNEVIDMQGGIVVGSRPDPGPFDNRDGEEVLGLINCFIARYGLERVGAVDQLEVMIHDYLPEEISCRREAFVWLRDHWSDYLTVNNEQLTMNNEVTGIQEGIAVNNDQLTMNNEVTGIQEPADVKPGRKGNDSKIIYKIVGLTG